MILRARTIQPSACLDVELWDAEQGTCLPLFRAFAGLWCVADREGRFEWKPREIKLVVLPHWDGDFANCLEALARGGFVVPYEVNGRKYGLVRNFKKHQHINPKEAESKLPPVPRGTRDPREDDATASRSNQELHGLFSDLEQDHVSEDPDSSSVSDSDSDLTGSARVGKKSPFRTDDERAAFGLWESKVWRKLHGAGGARATPRRLSPIRARLREGITLSQFAQACDAVAQSTFHLGQNDTGKAYIEPGTLFRNREKFEEWLTVRAPKPPGAVEHERQQAEEDRRLLDQAKRGEWGKAAQQRAIAGTIDMKRFKEWIRANNVQRRPTGTAGVVVGGLLNGLAPKQETA